MSEHPETVAPSRRYGLSTEEALLRLHEDIQTELDVMQKELDGKKLFYWLKESLSFKSELSKMRWPSVLFMTGQVIAHLVVAFVLDVGNEAVDWVGFQGLLLTGLLILNLTVNLWDTKLRFKELLMKSRQLLKLVKQCSHNKHLLRHWRLHSLNSTRNLFVPKSPSVHQTITYRDDGCLNLPDYLLVKGDIIHLFPGEQAPCECASVNMINQMRVFLKQGEIFLDLRSQQLKSGFIGGVRNASNQFQHAKLKPPIKGTDFIAISTPYINSLRISLQRSHKRPVNSVEKECFIISRKYFETIVIPLVFLLSTIITAIHYGYLDLNDSGKQIKTITLAYLLLRPSLTVMPFLPWMFPCLWLLVNAYGSARLLCCAQALSNKSKQNQVAELENLEDSKLDASNHLETDKFDNLLATPTAAGSSENKHDEDELCELKNKIKLRDILNMFVDLILAKSGHVWRSSNLLQVLGCLTSLCCIDKVGILSGSSPTPEKVCIIRTEDKVDQCKSTTLTQSDDSVSGHLDDGILENGTRQDSDKRDSNKRLTTKSKFTSCHHLEVLDLSHSTDCFQNFNIETLLNPRDSKLHFDDLNWKKYLNNLKPIGLAILMNNCCEKSFGDYFRFYRHISYESIIRCNLTPVVKRRCLCTLARLIGFSQDALDDYKYVNQIGIYRLINDSTLKADHLGSPGENASRLKLPFPSVTCNIQQNKETGSRQIFSHGTADLVLDACIEFWNGNQLVQLNESVRKKILDFYHRTSLTSYCSAFSYAPLLNRYNFGEGYLELPIGHSRFTSRLKKISDHYQEYQPQNQMTDIHEKVESHNNLSMDSSSYSTNLNESAISMDLSTKRHGTCKKKVPGITRSYLSVENIDDLTERLPTTNRTPKSEEIASRRSQKLNDALDEITDQVFIGMVATQYQACADFVVLVEQLEHACIRFVHFSKENELRSRVFSEKMGLESGWNCHVSLQSDLKPSNKLATSEQQSTKHSVDLQTSPTQYVLPEDGLNQPPIKVRTVLSGLQGADRKGGLNNDVEAGEPISLDNRALYSWKSLPSLIMQFTSNFSRQKRPSTTPQDQNTGPSMNFTRPDYAIDASMEDQTPLSDYTSDQPHLFSVINGEPETNSVQEDGFEALAYDMSNRAKLPKGIENIRPHLETVDNVPLQVSLFTDCTPELTREMIEIMQDYGEIVCVIGCSLSKLNTSVFLQANASIAIEPLAPQSCVRASAIQRSRISRQAREKRKRRIVDRKSSRSSTSSMTSTGQSKDIARKKDTRNSCDSDEESSSSSDSFSSSSRSSRGSSSSSSSSTRSSSTSSTSLFEMRSAPKSSSSSTDDETNGQVAADQADTSDMDESSRILISELPDPSSLASKLASLPCCYSYNRKDSTNLYSLIMEARHFTFKMKNTFVCMICFALSISSAQFLASLLFLPPMLSSGLTIWLTVVVVPLMSFSLMSTPIDSQVMKIAVGKNLQLKPDNITFFVVCYLIKFIPSIIVAVLCFGLIIDHSCKSTGFGSTSLGPCWMFTYVQHGLANGTSNIIKTDDEYRDSIWSAHLLTGQACAAFLLVLYFVVISAGFVHPSHLMWQRSPTRSHIWVVISIGLLIGQLICNQLILHFNLPSYQKSYEFLASLPAHICVISFVSPILVIGINLLVKRAEIKATIRQQRRARFDFNTKLGMNSPF